PAVVGMHAGAVGVENARDANAHVVFPCVIEKQSFGAPFSFIVTGSNPNRVYIAPITFLLRVHVGIAIDFTRGSLENGAKILSGKLQKMDRPEDTGFERL